MKDWPDCLSVVSKREKDVTHFRGFVDDYKILLE